MNFYLSRRQEENMIFYLSRRQGEKMVFFLSRRQGENMVFFLSPRQGDKKEISLKCPLAGYISNHFMILYCGKRLKLQKDQNAC